MEPLRLEIWVNALPEFVWLAWTITERVERWFSPEAKIIAELGGAYELFFDPEDHSQQSTIGCVITHIEPMKKLRFTWKGPDQFRKLMNSPEAVTSVQVTYEMKEVELKFSLSMEDGKMAKLGPQLVSGIEERGLMF